MSLARTRRLESLHRAAGLNAPAILAAETIEAAAGLPRPAGRPVVLIATGVPRSPDDTLPADDRPC